MEHDDAQELAQWLARGLTWTWRADLTFAVRTTATRAARRLRDRLDGALADRLQAPVPWVAGLEWTTSGHPHWHVVLGTPSTTYAESTAEWLGRRLWPWGLSRIEPIKDPIRSLTYAVKRGEWMCSRSVKELIRARNRAADLGP